MNPQKISLKINQIIEMLKNYLKRPPHYAAFVPLIRDMEKLNLDDIPSIEVLFVFFNARYEATRALKNKDPKENNTISPLSIYCEESQIQLTSLNQDFIDFYSHVIYTFHLLYRQKYLFKQFNEMTTTPHSFGDIDILTEAYIDENEAGSLLDEQVEAALSEFDLLIAKLILLVKNKGYLSPEWGKIVDSTRKEESTPFVTNILAWLSCLPSDIPPPEEKEAADTGSSFTSSVKQTYEFAKRAQSYGNRDNLYDYHIDGIAKAYQMRKIIRNVDGKMTRYLSHITNIAAEIHEQYLLQEARTKEIALTLNPLKKVQQLLAAMAKRVLIEEGAPKAAGRLELMNALNHLFKYFRMSEEEKKFILSLRHDLSHFMRQNGKHKKELIELNEHRAQFLERKKNNRLKDNHLQRQLEVAKICWSQCRENIQATAKLYAKISLLDVKVSFRQLAINNIKFALLGTVLLGMAAGLLGAFVLLLSPIWLGLSIIGAALIGANIFFFSGLFFDYRHIRPKPEISSLIPFIENYPSLLPKDEPGLQFDWEKDEAREELAPAESLLTTIKPAQLQPIGAPVGSAKFLLWNKLQSAAKSPQASFSSPQMKC